MQPSEQLQLSSASTLHSHEQACNSRAQWSKSAWPLPQLVVGCLRQTGAESVASASVWIVDCRCIRFTLLCSRSLAQPPLNDEERREKRGAGGEDSGDRTRTEHSAHDEPSRQGWRT